MSPRRAGAEQSLQQVMEENQRVKTELSQVKEESKRVREEASKGIAARDEGLKKRDSIILKLKKEGKQSRVQLEKVEGQLEQLRRETKLGEELLVT